LHHLCQYFDPFEIKIGATDIFALSNNTKAPKKWQKDANKGEKKQMFGSELNLALALLLVQS